MQSPQPPPDDVLTDEEARRRELLVLARRPSYRQILNDLEVVGQHFQPKLELISDRSEAPSSSVGHQTTTITSATILPVAHSSNRSHLNGSPSSTTSDNVLKLPDALTVTQLDLRKRLEVATSNGKLRINELSPHSRPVLLQYAQQQHHPGQNLLLPLNGDVLNLTKALSAANPPVGLASMGVVDASASVSSLVTTTSPAASLLAAAVFAAPHLAAAAAALAPTPPFRDSSSAITTAPHQPQSSMVNSPVVTSSPFFINNQMAQPPAIILSDEICGGNSPAAILGANVTQSTVNVSSRHDDVDHRREVRLLKNREAAKECRRKKKEYIKCLENRVNTLEQQNQQLIEELKNLKALYCRQNE